MLKKRKSIQSHAINYFDTSLKCVTNKFYEDLKLKKKSPMAFFAELE